MFGVEKNELKQNKHSVATKTINYTESDFFFFAEHKKRSLYKQIFIMSTRKNKKESLTRIYHIRPHIYVQAIAIAADERKNHWQTISTMAKMAFIHVWFVHLCHYQIARLLDLRSHGLHRNAQEW